MTQSNPGIERLVNNAKFQAAAPDVNSNFREDGGLWVNSDTLQMYVFSSDIDSNGTPGWIGVTSGQNQGSIIYTGPNPPTLKEVYPQIVETDDFPLDPLPGTVWYDTDKNLLKIWYVTPNVGNPDDPDVDPYTGQWVSVTTSHYLTQATADLITDLQAQIKDLEEQINILDGIVNP